MRATDRLCLAVAAAMVLASTSLMPLTVDRSFLWMGAILVLGLQLVSLLGRRLGLSGTVVHLVQLVLLVAVAIGAGLYWAPPAPVGVDAPTRLWRFYLDGVTQVRTQVAPMRFARSVRWISLILLGLFTILADMLAITLVSPSWVLAPMLSLYLIPALALTKDVSWPPFVALAAGYLLVLAAESINENAAWTRNLSADTAEKSHSSTGAMRLAALVAVPAVALSLLLGAALPLVGSLDIQSKRPRGTGPLQMEDPTIDLSRNLNLPVDRVVLTYKTDQERGLYLRTASMTVVDAKGWHLSPVSLVDGALPPAPGLEQPGKNIEVSVKVNDMGGEYLPAPYAPVSYQAPGQWRHDPVSLAIISTREQNRKDSIRNLEYSVNAVLNDPVAENFSVAKAGTPADAKQTAVVPKDVPDEILRLTHDITKDAATPVLKAAAIQAYLADPRNFAYSTTAPQGDGYDVLVNFLTKDKAGYCVHFASAMALMARLEGIPSRVSVGFLPGEKKGDHWEVKASNMHAWPELYFDGYGWVRFEPTSRVASAPDWTMVSESVKPLPSASASVGQSSAPASQQSVSKSPTPSASASTPKTGGDDGQGAGLPWGKILAWSAGALGLLLLLASPALLRVARRRRRLSLTGEDALRVEGAWAEVRDSVRDLRLAWPSGSPRERAAGITPEVGEDAAPALERLALLVERARYARSVDVADEDLAADVAAIRQGLSVDRPWSDKLWATLLPSSLLTSGADRRAEKEAERQSAAEQENTGQGNGEPTQVSQATSSELDRRGE